MWNSIYKNIVSDSIGWLNYPMTKTFVALLFFVQTLAVTFLAEAGSVTPAVAESALKNQNLIVSQIVAQQGSLAEPLGGSYQAGEEIFKKSNGTKEAQVFFKEKGLVLLLNTGQKNPLGLCDEKMAQKLLLDPSITRFKVPSTGDIVSKNKQNYYDAARAFATAFNKQMLAYKKIRTPDC